MANESAMLEWRHHDQVDSDSLIKTQEMRGIPGERREKGEGGTDKEECYVFMQTRKVCHEWRELLWTTDTMYMNNNFCTTFCAAL